MKQSNYKTFFSRIIIASTLVFIAISYTQSPEVNRNYIPLIFIVIFAARLGDFKLVYYENNPPGYPESLNKLENPLFFNLMHDPSERFDISKNNIEIIDEINEMEESLLETVSIFESK